MTSTLAATNEHAVIESTVAFLTEHLGHRISTYNRHRNSRSYWTHARIDPDTDTAYEPYERPWWLKGPDTDTFGASRSIRHVFAAADEITCTDCATSRPAAPDTTRADTLAALKALAAPYLASTDSLAAPHGHTALRDALDMSHLISTLADA